MNSAQYHMTKSLSIYVHVYDYKRKTEDEEDMSLLHQRV